jgi:hypothetical protein
MPMREPKPKPPSPMQRKKLDKMMAVARGKKVDPTDYMGPKKKKPSPSGRPTPKQTPKPRNKPKSPAAIGENLPKFPSRPKKKPTSGSTSARIRNMEKMYSKRKGIREL